MPKATTKENVKTEVKVLPNDFDALEYMYSETEEKIKVLNGQRNALKKTIIAKFEAEYGHQGQSVISNLTGNTLQRVLNVLQDIDDAKLKNLVPKEIWKEITIEKPSLELVLSAIKMGRINPAVIAPALSSKEVDKLVVRKAK